MATLELPDRIGPYHVVQLIGEGGMGVVYEAEQKQPVRRRVAVKMMKLGMDTKEVVGRFEAERQALAVMDHPSIAKVFDAGVSDEGRPYFAMELVRGLRIDAYCDEHRLNTADRVALFSKVCDAVQHAHQKGVIHRDLKPGNILVTAGADEPLPKVIDFGVAKATGLRLTEHTVVTTYGQALGTLAYMSPEQAEMSGLDVDTRADVYSLGIILYELLLGVVPLDPGELGAPAFLASLIQRDTPPPTPRRRFTSLSEDKQRIVARFRATDTDSLRREVSGDLQWIVLRAIEKERNRRYDTASELSQDLKRFLSHEPVSAHPPSHAYRFRKFVRRNTPAVLAAAVIALAVVGAGAATYVSGQRAAASERVAQAEAARAEAANQFLVEIIGAANPSADGRDVRVAELLDGASVEAGDRFREDPATEGAVRLALGATYQGLGLYEEARRELMQSADIYREIDDPALPDALHELGQLLTLLGEWEEAEKVQSNELDARRIHDGEASVATAHTLSAIGERMYYLGNLEEARRLFADALAIFEEQLPPDSEAVVGGLANLSAILQRLDHTEEAVPLLERSLSGMKSLKGPDHVDVATVSGNLAIGLQTLGRLEEAEPLLVDAVRIMRAAYGDRSDRVARTLNNLGLYYRRVERYDEAIPMLREALGINQEVHGPVHREVASNLHNLGLVASDLERYEEAAEYHERALAINLEVRPNHATVPQSRTGLGWAYRSLGRLEDAERELRLGREEAAAVHGPEHYRVANIDALLADVFRQSGRPQNAERSLAAAIPILEEQLESGHPFLTRAYALAADLHSELGNESQAAEFRARAATARR